MSVSPDGAGQASLSLPYTKYIDMLNAWPTVPLQIARGIISDKKLLNKN